MISARHLYVLEAGFHYYANGARLCAKTSPAASRYALEAALCYEARGELARRYAGRSAAAERLTDDPNVTTLSGSEVDHGR